MELKGKDCEICFVVKSQYQCPSCNIRTCSLNCVIKHKDQLDCNGKIDPTKFVPSEKLFKDSQYLNRDYKFLQDIGRKISVSKRLKDEGPFSSVFDNKKKKLQPVKGRKFSEKETKKLKYVEQQFGMDIERSVVLKNTIILRSGIGMKRHLRNKSGYNKKLKSFFWTIEWILMSENIEKDRFMSYRVCENKKLVEAIPDFIFQKYELKDKFDKFDKSDCCMYLKNAFVVDDEKNFFFLDQNDAICDILANHFVLDYPTIYISHNCANFFKETTKM